MSGGVLSYRALYTQTQLLLELAGLEDDEATSVRERLFARLYTQNDRFAKTGSGQTFLFWLQRARFLFYPEPVLATHRFP